MSELSSRAKATLEHFRNAETLGADRKQELLAALQGRIARGDVPSDGINVDPPTWPVTPGLAPQGVSALTKFVVAAGVAAAVVVPAIYFLRDDADETSHVTEPAPLAVEKTKPATPIASPSAVVDDGIPSADLKDLDIEEPEAEPTRSKSKSPSAPRATAPATIDEEVRLLKSAQNALNSGQAGRALQVLDEHASRFPKSKLGDAREVTRMMAVCRLGQKARARDLAKRFLAKNPSSPFSDRVRRICE